jgi:hypothetical protein
MLQPSSLNCPAHPHSQARAHFSAGTQDNYIASELRHSGNIPFGRPRQALFQLVFIEDGVSHGRLSAPR